MPTLRPATILRFACSLGLLALLYTLVDWPELGQVVAQMRLAPYALGVLLYVFATGVLWALRWWLLLRASGLPVALRQLVSINLVASFFTNFLPTTVGGDMVRVYELSRRRGAVETVLATVLVDRLIGLTAVLLMALFALGVGYQYAGERAVVITVTVAALGLGAGLALLWNRQVLRSLGWVFRLPVIGRLEPYIQQLDTALHVLQRGRRSLAQTLGVTLCAQVLEVCSVLAFTRALGIQAPLAYAFIALPLIWIVTLVPFSFGGVGIRESAFVLLYGAIGVPAAHAMALSLLVYSARLLLGAAGGLVFLIESFKPRYRVRTLEHMSGQPEG
jgi:hypothetical protein